MRYYCNLYMSKKLLPKKEKILDGLDTYIVALAQGAQNHLEIFHAALLIQKKIPEDRVFVVGITDGYDKALEVVEKITKEVYDNTKGTDIRNYILKKQQEYEEGNV